MSFHRTEIWFSVPAFPIPMRGNEWHKPNPMPESVRVSDPHEG